MRYEKKELKHLAISILIVTFVFAYGNLSLINFILIALMVAVTFFVHDIAHKLIAKRYGSSAQYRIWTIQRLGFRERAKSRPLPLGIILALYVTLLSSGRLFFTAIESFVLETKKYKRLGRKFLHITEGEVALIALSGPLANILLAYFLKIFGVFDDMVLINSLFALFHMVPISSLDGAKIFFGAKYLYVLSILFIIFSVFALQLLSSIEGFLLSIFLAVFGLVVFFLIYNKKFF